MKVLYDEGPAARDIAATGETVRRGEVYDAPDAIGKQLLKQGWQEPSTKTPARKAAPDPVEKETE